MFIRGLYAADIRLLDVFSRIRFVVCVYIYIFFLLFSFSVFTSAIIHRVNHRRTTRLVATLKPGKKQFYREREREREKEDIGERNEA